MTKIERDIYAALQRGELITTIAILYANAHGATYNVYSRIQWELLDAEIQKVHGKRGLNQCRRASVKQQQ